MRRYYIYLFLAIMVYSLVSVLSKAAALQDFLSMPFILLYGGALLLMAGYAVIWQICLERVPLVAAYMMRGILFVLIGIWSYLFFHEMLTLVQWIGMGVIIAGVYISQSGPAEENRPQEEHAGEHAQEIRETRSDGGGHDA